MTTFPACVVRDLLWLGANSAKTADGREVKFIPCSLWPVADETRNDPAAACEGRGGGGTITWADYSPPTLENWARFPAGLLPDFSTLEWYRTMPTGLRVFSGISRFPHLLIPAPLHSHLTSPSSALKTSVLRAARISPLHCKELSPNKDTWPITNGKLQVCHGPLESSLRVDLFAKNRHALDDSEPITDLQGNKYRVPYCQEFLRADEGEMRWEGSSAGTQGRRKWEILEKNPPTSTISTCGKSGMAQPGIELGSPWWKESIHVGLASGETTLSFVLLLPSVRSRNLFEYVRRCLLNYVHTCRTQQEPAPKVEPGETECIAATHEKAERHPVHTCCDVNCTTTIVRRVVWHVSRTIVNAERLSNQCTVNHSRRLMTPNSSQQPMEPRIALGQRVMIERTLVLLANRASTTPIKEKYCGVKGPAVLICVVCSATSVYVRCNNYCPMDHRRIQYLFRHVERCSAGRRDEKFASSVTSRIESTVLCTNMPSSAAHWLPPVTVESDDWASVLREVSNTAWTDDLKLHKRTCFELQLVSKRIREFSRSVRARRGHGMPKDTRVGGDEVVDRRRGDVGTKMRGPDGRKLAVRVRVGWPGEGGGVLGSLPTHAHAAAGVSHDDSSPEPRHRRRHASQGRTPGLLGDPRRKKAGLSGARRGESPSRLAQRASPGKKQVGHVFTPVMLPTLHTHCQYATQKLLARMGELSESIRRQTYVCAMKGLSRSGVQLARGRVAASRDPLDQSLAPA
ncbi:hypothetical protein PR048_030066 [Dryococelus australis]|uniref:Uncharacterized protein n=1 Tax=Dryococelus australis TaxID=614101 RepID=A0ABQ9G7W7_9NEOP|nr:hypothetical protein PR048_030066 [Dryococelus australis]